MKLNSPGDNNNDDYDYQFVINIKDQFNYRYMQAEKPNIHGTPVYVYCHLYQYRA